MKTQWKLPCCQEVQTIQNVMNVPLLAAKYCPDSTLLNQVYSRDINRLYDGHMSFNFVLALSILVVKGRFMEVKALKKHF